MDRYISLAMLVILTPILTILFFTIDLTVNTDKTFLTVSTFLFSIFTGFFISRQASRFNRVRETVTTFDGHLSSIYRNAEHIHSDLRDAVGLVIVAHYERIFSSRQWNIHFLQKSTTLQEIHRLLRAHIVDDTVTKLSNQAIGAIIKSLAACQNVRKQMIALYEERIPYAQWLLLLFFTLIVTVTVGVLPSQGLLLESILKAAFIAAVCSILYILYQLNNLAYSESLMGQHSAEDVIAIVKGEK